MKRIKLSKRNMALLGVVPDGQLAKKCGCSKLTISKNRKRLGTPPFTGKYAPKFKVQEHAHLLGQIPDIRLAEMCDCSRERIRQLRVARGIRKHQSCTILRAVKKLREEDDSLTDRQIAEKFNIHRKSVAYARKALGLSLNHSLKYSGLEMKALLANHTQKELAGILDTCQTNVSNIAFRYGYEYKRTAKQPKDWGAMDKKELRKLFKSHSQEELAKRFDVSRSRIQQIAKKYKLKTRGRNRGQ